MEENQPAAGHANSLQRQWRSRGGAAVHLLRGGMTMQYSTDFCQGS